MDFTRIYLAGVSAMVVFLVFDAFRRKGWISHKTVYSVVIVFVFLWNVGDFYRVKVNRQQQNIKGIEAQMLRTPILAVIKKYDPESFDKMKEKVTRMIADNKNQQSYIDDLQNDIVTIQRKRYKFATNKDIVSVLRINMEQLAYAKGISGELCYRILYPEASVSINSVKIFPEEMKSKILSVNAEMIKNSYGRKKHTVTDDELSRARGDFANILNKLRMKYGSDTEIIYDPKRGVGKYKLACEINQDLLSYMLALPNENSAGVARMLMSSY